MTESYPRAANLLGALAIVVADRIQEATGEGTDGLTLSDAAALVTLAHYPGQPIIGLSATLGLSHSGAVRLTDRMEAAGLVHRTASGQGRTLAIRLTARGELAASRVVARRQEAVKEMVSPLDAADAAALERIAGQLLAAITTDQTAARRLCRLCDEPLCARDPGCPVDHAARA